MNWPQRALNDCTNSAHHLAPQPARLTGCRAGCCTCLSAKPPDASVQEASDLQHFSSMQHKTQIITLQTPAIAICAVWFSFSACGCRTWDLSALRACALIPGCSRKHNVDLELVVGHCQRYVYCPPHGDWGVIGLMTVGGQNRSKSLFQDEGPPSISFSGPEQHHEGQYTQNVGCKTFFVAPGHELHLLKTAYSLQLKIQQRVQHHIQCEHGIR